MVATDGFNFNQIANSQTLRKAMKADGHDISTKKSYKSQGTFYEAVWEIKRWNQEQNS